MNVTKDESQQKRAAWQEHAIVRETNDIRIGDIGIEKRALMKLPEDRYPNPHCVAIEGGKNDPGSWSTAWDAHNWAIPVRLKDDAPFELRVLIRKWKNSYLPFENTCSPRW